MTLAAERQVEHIGETKAMADHDRDLVHELSKRLDAMWRYDQYIANAEGDEDRRDFWRDLKRQDQKNVDRLRKLLRHEIENNCF